jgi:hypothetical protein
MKGFIGRSGSNSVSLFTSNPKPKGSKFWITFGAIIIFLIVIALVALRA